LWRTYKASLVRIRVNSVCVLFTIMIM